MLSLIVPELKAVTGRTLQAWKANETELNQTAMVSYQQSMLDCCHGNKGSTVAHVVSSDYLI